MSFAGLLACSCTGKKNAPESATTYHFDTSINPIVPIGAYYTYEIGRDTLAGLLVSAIRKEEDSVYYSFYFSGKFFSTAPTEKEFQEAGLSGLLIPYYGTERFINGFAEYALSETRLKSLLSKMKKIGQINFSKKNMRGATRPLHSFEELVGEYKMFEVANAKDEKEKAVAGYLMPKYVVIKWDDLAVTNDPTEMVKPEIVWIISPKSAHPKAASLMNEEWYWDEVDELTPFGNDDGSDAVHFFKTWREKNKDEDPALFIDALEKDWDFSFSHINNDSEKDLPAIEKANPFYRNVDRAVIGIAFGQLILEGTISSKLKKLGLKAINRTKTEHGMNGMTEGNKKEYTSRLNKMEEILNQF